MSSSSGWLSRVRTRLGGAARDDSPLLEFAPENPVETTSGAQPRGPRRRLWYAGLVLVAGVGVAAMGMSRWQGVSAGAASLTINSRPAGALVTVDGADHGATPLTLQIAPGSHDVTVRSGSQERSFSVNAGAGSDILRDFEFAPPPVPVVETVVAAPEPPPPVAPAVGWLRISAPFDVQLIEDGEVIGDGDARLTLRAGTHDLVVMNSALGYEEDRRVSVGVGQTVSVRIDAPVVALNINARPWAEVSLDGVSLGQTPIANALVPIGARRLVFRHPELGERQQNVVVTTKAGQRIAIDLTR
jgi:hypothetical protein